MTQAQEAQGIGEALSPDFAALETAWQEFSVFFSKTANIPESAAAFEAKYGQLDDPTLDSFIANCAIANTCAAALGSSAAFRQQMARDPGLLERADPPDTMLGEIFWLCSLIQNAASTYRNTLQSLEILLPPSSGDAQERADKLKQVLTGTNGVVPAFIDIKAKTLMFDQRVAQLLERLNAANEGISQCTVLNAANQQIGAQESRLSDRKQQLLQAKQQSEGAFFGKEEKLKSYETSLKEYTRLDGEYARKRQFVADVDNIFAAGTAAVLALSTVRNQVQKVGKLMADSRSMLMSLCTAADTEQLSDYRWVAKALGMPGSLNSWSRLIDNARRFQIEEFAK